MSDDIPSELQREILLRLPAEPLLRFRIVCKSWRRTIDDPSFARSHFINNQRSSTNLLIKPVTGALYSLSLDSLIHANGEQTIDATRVNPLVRQDVALKFQFPVSNCNGLILFYESYENNKTWLIWNPFVLDLATEEYRQIVQPPEWRFPWDTSMIVLDGCLILSVVGPTKRAWVMVINDNTVESWVELFSSVERHVIDGWRSEYDCPISYSKSQRQLILQHKHGNEIIVCDIEKCSAKMVTIHGLPVPHSSQILPISIFRLNNSVDGVKREMNEANTRLKLSVTTSTDIPCHSVCDDSPGEEEVEVNKYHVGRSTCGFGMDILAKYRLHSLHYRNDTSSCMYTKHVLLEDLNYFDVIVICQCET